MENELPTWVATIIAQSGPFAVVLLIMFWYVPRASVSNFIKAQQDQAIALHLLAESVKSLPQKDEMKFEAILIGQELTHKELQRLHDRLEGMENLIRNGHGAT